LAIQPAEDAIMAIVSGETYDRTAAESVRPSSENRQTLARFGVRAEIVAGRVRARMLDMVNP
jgi:hypothetical protein